MSDLMQKADWSKSSDGLLPAIIQDSRTGAVLMLGYMNEEALKQTIDKNTVTFFSRSKQRLWKKGETSGNILEVVDLQIDCDNDTFLIQAKPAGPTCHTGDVTCFGETDYCGLLFLSKLENIIEDRKNNQTDESYTTSLFQSGVKRISQKVGEEGVELSLAGATADIEEMKNEGADLIFHMLVLLKAYGLGLDDVMQILQKRHKKA